MLLIFFIYEFLFFVVFLLTFLHLCLYNNLKGIWQLPRKLSVNKLVGSTRLKVIDVLIYFCTICMLFSVLYRCAVQCSRYASVLPRAASDVTALRGFTVIVQTSV